MRLGADAKLVARRRPLAEALALRPPIAFTYGNCVFARGVRDAWAAFAVESASYAWLQESSKRARFLALVGALEAVQADVQIVRVARRWRAESCLRELALGPGHERSPGPQRGRAGDTRKVT